nr:MAG TPA: hypothetical protein [Caudoviricetes sp.]
MSYLTEAFKALDALNEDTFSVSDDGIKKLAEFEDNDDLVDEITVYDADAEDTEDLEDSYVGKVIVDCNVCHSKIYKDKSDVVIDEETQNANIDEECPYCYSTDGFKVIGEVAPMTTETEEKVKVEDDIEESLNESIVEGVEPQTSYEDAKQLVKNIDKFLKEIEENGVSAQYFSSDDLDALHKGIDAIVDFTEVYISNFNESLNEATVSPNSILDWLSDHEQVWKDFTMYFAGTDLSKLSTSEIVDWISEHDELYSDYERYFNINESLSEATVTDYKGSLSNILVKNQDKISKMTTKGEIVKFLDSITDEVRDKNYLETVKRNMQKKNDFGALQYIYGIILSGEGKGVKESVTEGFKEEDESVNKDLLWAFRKLLREHPQTDIVFTSSYTKDGEIILEPTSYEDFGKLHLFKIDNALKSKGYQISTNKHLYILDKDASIENGNIHIPYEVKDPEEDPDDIDYVYKWDDDKLEVPGTTYSEDDIVQKVYEIVTEDLDLDYDTIDSTQRGNTVIVTVYGNEEEFEDEEVDSLVDELSEYLENKAKVRAHINSNYDMVIKVELPKGMLVENIKENIGTDIDEYQQWVDYDMKRYGKISDQTNKEIKEAGLQVVKDKYGDYQVIAGNYDESLHEDITLKLLDDYDYDTLQAIEDDNDELFDALQNYPELIQDDEVIIPKGTRIIYTYTDADYKYYELPEYGNMEIRILADEYPNFKKYITTSTDNESLKESVKDVTITTDDSRTTMTSEENGKVTVTTEPVEQPKDDEVIEPLTDETEAEIEANDGEEDIDIEDFDEESFDELGEGYFKNVYENVDSFKTSNITTNDNKVIVEGVITFNNNVKKNTSFLFESANKTKNGKYRFIGENLNVTKGNKAFSLIGNVTDKKFLSESMNYNYRTKNDIGKFIRCCGTIKRG